jgi:phosphoglycerate dehydrogenase-like enzyme
MTASVLCLRPKIDFERVGSLPSTSLNVLYRAPADQDVPELIRKVQALVIPAVGPKLDGSLFDNAALRLVQVTGAGRDRLDSAVRKRAGIPVATVPGASNQAVAEYVVTCASLLLRRFAWVNSEIREGHYVDFRARMLNDNLSGLDGLLVGIVGFGVIGLAVAEAFHKMGCRIAYYDPAPQNPHFVSSVGARSMPLSELLEASDVVTLHVPLLPATTGLIGAKELATMKDGAILIQASRGGVVDENALVDALQSEHLGGAAVDVYTAEPPPTDHPLIALRGEAARRLILTPHIAGVTRQSAERLFRSAWRNVERVLIANEPPLNRVY